MPHKNKKTKLSTNPSLNKSSFFGSDPALPVELQELIGSHLDYRDLIHLGQASFQSGRYQYINKKIDLVKHLKKLVQEDDTAKVASMLASNSCLLLRKDKRDPKGIAYRGIETTPYQDTLADPFQEEMRAVLESSFPGSANEEKLAHAAKQADEFKDPRFDKIRNAQHEIMRQTQFAYETYIRIVNLWNAAGRNLNNVQPLRDAWTRLGLAQDRWSKRLRKIFSQVGMDAHQTFENLPRDIPEPRFHSFRGEIGDPWQPASVCRLWLKRATEGEDLNLNAGSFLAILEPAFRLFPTLIQQGKGDSALFYFHAPHIPLDQEHSEWRLVKIDDPEVIQLIRTGRPGAGRLGSPPDFHQESFRSNPLFHRLYQFAARHQLYIQSGAAYNVGSPKSCELRFGDCIIEGGWGIAGWVPAEENMGAVTRFYEKRKTGLQLRLEELARYLPGQQNTRDLEFKP